MRQADTAVMAVAATQFGLVTRTQLLAGGLSAKAIEWRLESGFLVGVHRGVYRLAASPPSWRQRGLALCLTHEGRAAMSHRSAGFVHQLDGLSLTSGFDVLLRGQQRIHLEGIRCHRTASQFDIVRVRGLPVTNLARTVLDLASVLEPDAYERALDSAQRQRRNLGPWLGYVMKKLDMRGPPGVARVKELLAQRLGINDSSLETDVTRALRRAGVSPWKHQYTVVDDQGRRIIRADFAWPRHRIVLHADSFNWHTHREQFDLDREQRNALRDANWEELVVTSTSLKSEVWLGQLRRLLARRDPQAELALRAR
ncbi:MAG: type IV toxin-antitoxin system AbiEi family antitoxin domain-containing protein [Archangium sp.]